MCFMCVIKMSVFFISHRTERQNSHGKPIFLLPRFVTMVHKIKFHKVFWWQGSEFVHYILEI